jgi:protein gp37
MSKELNDGAFIVQGDLAIHPIALLLPPMNDAEYKEFKDDILGNGLHNPIILYQDKVLDGRNRYLACKELEIDVWAREWEGGSDPIEYVISQNIHRRHLTAGQRSMVAAKALDFHIEAARARQRVAGIVHSDNLKKGNEVIPRLVASLPQAGTPDPEEKKPFASTADENKARSQAGKLLNVSGRSVAAAAVVLKHGTDDEKKDVETGKVGLAKVEKQVRERAKNTPRPEEKQVFNKEKSDSIEWSKWTWNPVTGCSYACQYCYARDIGDRFQGGFEPKFHPERLSAPINTRLPTDTGNGNLNVFVCSMAELFGDWVPQEWIDQVIESCTKAPEWNFIFLTKNPKRLIGIKWPKNAWVGTTVDCQSRVNSAVAAFDELNKHPYRPVVTFLSCEPMNERLDFGDRGLHSFDWIIIGGRSVSSRMPAFQPEWEWVEKLHNEARAAGCKVYWKPNLTVRPKEYPTGI